MTRPTYITLTSIPPRFAHLGPTLDSLVAQKPGATQVVLYIPQSYRRFPDWDGQLPKVPTGVTILRVAQDDGPATKVLPALRQFAGQDVNILFCDDDNLYPDDWLAGFLEASRDHPNAAIASSGLDLRIETTARPAERLPRFIRWTDEGLGLHLANLPAPLPMQKPLTQTSGFADTLYGRGGAMVRPSFFTDAIFDLPPVIWAVDDFWLSGHLEVNNTDIWVDARIPNPMTLPCLTLIRPLFAAVIEKHDRRQANQACIDWFRREYGIWHPGSANESIPLWVQIEQKPKQRQSRAANLPQSRKLRPPRWKRVLRALFGS